VWIIVVAAIVAFVLLFDAVGPIFAALLIAIALAGLFGYRYYRAKHPPESFGLRCLKCGEILPYTARHCDACGSASWTYRN
jgi:hypothetical protein